MPSMIGRRKRPTNVAVRERLTHFAKVKSRIRERYREGLPVRVGFFVLYDSAFPARGVAKSLVGDDRFEPVIVLIPDTFRGLDNMVGQLRKSKAAFQGLGISIISGFDEQTHEYVDVSDSLDFVCISNPYDELTHEYFTTRYLSGRSVLPFFVSYGFSLSQLHLTLIRRESFRNYWRIFVPTRLNHRDYRRHANVLPGAVEVTGYCKMDALAEFPKGATERPSIVIAPHHTVREWPGGLELSTFLTYADAILDLPREYPEIDFVFRPHPLLFVHLKADDLWGPERSASYLSELATHPNVVIDNSTEYLETFSRSSALIHDSGSFSAEYLLTGSPALFLSTPDRDPSLQFAELGKTCLEHHYHATSSAQIHDFIDRVVIGGDDPMRRARERFVQTTLMPHYPRAGERIVRRLATVLTSRRSLHGGTNT